MKIDSQAMVKAIDKCLDLSMDGTLSLFQRQKMLDLGIFMRDRLVKVLSASFPDGLAEVNSANAGLQAVNQNLDDANKVLTNFAGIVRKITDTVALIDDLLSNPVLKALV